MALFARFLGRSAAEGAGFAFGRATAPVLSPALEELRQEAWQFYSTRIPDAGVLAAGVAQGQVDRGKAEDWASRHGFGKESFGALVDIANTGPDVGMAMQAWRRGRLTEDEFRTVLRRHAIETRWDEAIEALKAELLPPADLAQAIHRGLIPDPGLLQGDLPAGVGNVPAYPVYDVDAIEEAEAFGFDRKRLGVLVGLQGNPMGAHEAAEALFRDILTEDDYLRAIAEGNTRNEWAEAIKDQTRQIPTARDFLENALRGYRKLPEALKGAARHGMSEEDATMIYQNQGRPMVVRQITQALARGGKFRPEPGEIKDPYDAAIVEGNLKPAYYDLAKALRYTLPSPFVMRQLAASGVWSEAKTAERLKWAGWFPEDADEAAKAWATPAAATADSHIGKAQTQLWNATHSSYINREASPTVARNKLQQAGVAASAVNAIIGLWDAERELIRKGLTPANIKKAYNKGGRNTLTGQPWTRDEALAALVNMGWNVTEANDYLDIP